MMCGCHLPAMVHYMNSTYERTVKVLGKCHTDSANKQDEVIPIMQYSKCKNYSLFQKNLQCQTCSEMMCKDSQVTNCTGESPVCQYKLSMNSVTLKFERSCSTYRNCLEAMRNNTSTCNEWANGTSCVACCSGNLCNKNDFMGWTNSFEFHLIYTMDPAKKFNEKKTFAENVSRVVSRHTFSFVVSLCLSLSLTLTISLTHIQTRTHELSRLKRGEFKVEYCSSKNSLVIFTIYYITNIKSTKDQVLQEIDPILDKSQALRNMGIQKSKVFGEKICNEDTSTNNGTLHWPMTEIRKTATITCHTNEATRHWFVSIVFSLHKF
ncbi:uncharacterized protein LOC106873848 [Octopus bimaculoides]|uniref:uncharacterized protein LOC106873848 n=1 Tax=Octopus bimaculoides TaxID=37653 RepID=UPI0022E945BB|nr:uncharacterized protein LOC106873848 [Octopus bimaculoides]